MCKLHIRQVNTSQYISIHQVACEKIDPIVSLLSKPTLSQVTHIAFTLNRIHDKDWAMNGIGLLKTRLSFKHDPINQNPC